MPGLIDVHHHFMSQAYLDAIGVERAASPGSAGHVEPWTTQQSLEFMDKAGIEASIVSVSAPGIDMGTPLATSDLARACNEAQARMVHDHPKRFGSLAILPLPHIELSLGEIEYAFGTLKADGVVMMSNYGGEYIGSPKFWPVFEELNRRKAVAFFHPVAPEGYRGFPGRLALHHGVSVRHGAGDHEHALLRHAGAVPRHEHDLLARRRRHALSRRPHGGAVAAEQGLQA